MRIDLLVGENQYDSTLYFSKKLSEALERQGVNTRLFWVADGNFHEAARAIMHEPPDLTCSFSDITVGDNQPIGDQWQIPHLSMLLDPAIYSLHQLKGEYSLISCVDEEDVAFVKELGFERAFFLPHGVDHDLSGYEERSYEAVFFGSCFDYEKINASWSPKIRPLLEQAAERVLSPEGISTLRALLEAGVEKGLPTYHHEVDLYVRAKDRVELVRAFSSTPVHIWGSGPWKRLCPNAIVHRSIPFEKTIEKMKRAKLLLNSAPRFKHGSHERILYGLACGCSVLTGESSFITNHFHDEPSLYTYRYGHWQEISPKYSERKVNLNHHSWDQRAKTLITFVKNFFETNHALV